MKLLPLALLLLSACAATGGGSAPLRVASDLDNKPFAFVDEEGEAAGRDVQMMQAVAQRMGREIEWVPMPYEELLPAAREGKVDVVCATLGVTPERAREVDFSRPYFRTELVAVTLAGPAAPTCIADLSGRSVAAGAGTTSARAVSMRAPAAHLVTGSKTGSTAGDRLLSGEVVAVVMDGPAAEALIARSGGKLARLPESFGPEDYALVLPRGSALRERLDAALADCERDGTLARLDEEHGVRQVHGAPEARPPAPRR
jgi:ABC-type amino acid transport substrate-binding protein